MSLPVYKHSTLYLVVRCVDHLSLLSIASSPLLLTDLRPVRGLRVFDLAHDLHLDSLHDALHSSNLGANTRFLHDLDIDFVKYTAAVAGALAGVDCGQYEWSLQVVNHSKVLHSVGGGTVFFNSCFTHSSIYSSF